MSASLRSSICLFSIAASSNLYDSFSSELSLCQHALDCFDLETIYLFLASSKKTSVKVKKRDGTPPTSDKELLSEWKEYFSSLLNNCSGQSSSELPLPAAQDLQIQTDPPTRDETVLAISQMKTNKAAGLDAAITAEALQNGGDAMIDVVHRFCA